MFTAEGHGPRRLVEWVVNDILSLLPDGPHEGWFVGRAPSEVT